MRILLAEDDSVLADGLTRSLRQSGYATDCVSNGKKQIQHYPLRTSIY
jgi:two-component system OmpR family response regulator